MWSNRFSQLAFKSLSEINMVQEKLLRSHVEYCCSHSDFYRASLSDFDLENVQLQDLPITDKEQLSQYNDQFVAISEEEVADVVFSSGTTGKPTKIVYSHADLERLAYNEKQSFAGCGMTAADVVLLTCTMDRCFIAGLAYYLGAQALGAATLRNGHGTLESHGDVIQRACPTTVIGVPSFLRKLGLDLIGRGIDLSRGSVQRLICIGEPLRDEVMAPYQITSQLEKIWGAKCFSTYASSEMVTTFCECEAQRGGHLHPELGFVEILDDNGAPVPDGGVGEIVVTPLGVTGMPLLRFRSGDMSFVEKGACICGRNSLRLGPILGRKKQMLKVQGTTLYPQAVYAVLDEYPGVVEYYLKAESTGHALSDKLTVCIAVDNPDFDVSAAERAMQARLRVKPEILVEPRDAVRKVVFNSQSRKPMRFVDARREHGLHNT